MKLKHWIYFLLIAFFVGAMGSIVMGRFVIPYLAVSKGWTSLNKFATNSPIVINRTNEVQLNEGINLIDLGRQASQITVSIYRGDAPQMTFAGLGTIMSSDGLIFTSKSTIGSNTQMIVVLSDGTKYTGLVRAADPKSDLAVMTIPAQGLPTATFSAGTDLKAGQRILTLGIANQKFDREFTSGLVTNSVLNNKYLDQVFNSERLADSFGSDLTFRSNHSGSPLINLDGKLVGMVANDHNEILIAENMQTALTSYLQTGKIVRPQLGIQYWSLSELEASLKNLPRAGVVVLAADKDSPAAAAGLKQNDLIYEANGQSLDGKSFEQVLGSTPANGTLIVKFIRSGKEMEATITLKPTQ